MILVIRVPMSQKRIRKNQANHKKRQNNPGDDFRKPEAFPPARQEQGVIEQIEILHETSFNPHLKKISSTLSSW